ncbi:prospero homeobox protein 1-like [Pleurodeles waltl]|uniref:prospero homeobox protein 1-like n=1 Tax=Pleurodeles waltl TaxID=8319 RepID=UPI003709BE6C
MSLAVVDLKEECLDEEELEGTSYTYPFTFQNKETASGDQPVPYPDRNIISQLLRKGIVKTRNADTSEPGDPVDLCPARPVQEVSPQGSLFKRQLESEGFYEEFLKAKRARVENIVCNISSSCSSGFRNGGSSEGEDPVGSSYETPRRDAHTRKVERGQERSELKLQMEKMRDQLLQLQEKLYRMYTGMSEDYSGIGHPKERAARGVSGAGATKSRDPTDESCHFQDSKLSKERQKSRQSNVTEHGIRMLDSQPKCLAEALKEELSTAVTQVVDAVVQAFVRTGVQEVLPPVQVTSSHRLMEHGGSSTGTSSQPTPHYFEALSTGTSSEGDTVNFEEDQTEALPLVVRKNPTSQCESSSSHRQRLSPLGLDEGGLVVATFPPVTQYSIPKMSHTVPLGQLHFKERLPIEAFWEGVSLRTKLSSRHLMQQECPLFQLSGSVEGTSSAHVPKLESRDPHGSSDTSLYRPSSISFLTSVLRVETNSFNEHLHYWRQIGFRDSKGNTIKHKLLWGKEMELKEMLPNTHVVHTKGHKRVEIQVAINTLADEAAKPKVATSSVAVITCSRTRLDDERYG